MLAITRLQLCYLIAASLVAASPLLESRDSCSEGTQLICYGVSGGQSQGVSPDDVAYAASYLRYLGQNNNGTAAFLTMPAGSNCGDWTLPIDGAGTVLGLAKHVIPIANSSVLYTDIANTIDGGENASDVDKNLRSFLVLRMGGRWASKPTRRIRRITRLIT